MTRAIVFHGSYGFPEKSWFPWLKSNLEQAGIETYVPRLPTPEGQSLESWTKAFEKVCHGVLRDDILVGHSTGASFALRLLERSVTPVKGTVLVSGFARMLGIEKFDPIIETFVNSPFNWSEIRRKGGTIAQFHGSNDQYIPVDHAHDIARELGIKLNVIEGGAHLNMDAGYLEFPQVLDTVLKISAQNFSTHPVAVLSRAGVSFDERTFPAKEYSAEEVAKKLSIPLKQVYKTLIARTAGGEIVAGVVPGDRELDLAKLARAAGAPSADLVKLGEIESLTGYLKGGCSPIGLKIQYQVVIDTRAETLGPISVSAGERGRQLIVKAADLLQVVPGKFADIARY